MNKIRVFLRRVRTMSFRRMVLYARLAKSQRSRPLPLILLDMVWCSVRYGVGYLDYYSFGFIHQRGQKRRTYMTMNDNVALVRRLNDPKQKQIFEDKLRFLAAFSDCVGREWLDLRQGVAGFLSFTARHPVFFAKETGGFGGLGVRRCDARGQDLCEMYGELLEKGLVCVEEAVRQHPTMSLLCESSVNTVRMVTLLKDGQAHLMYALVRMGSGTGDVDNISSGGMYCPVGEDGSLTAPAFCDKTGLYYDEHPVTHTPFVGFRIPLYQQAVALVKEAALRIPEVRYVGWDVAIAEDGPLFIEGNTFPGYDMCQNYGHLSGDKQGIKPAFRAVLGDEFPAC